MRALRVLVGPIFVFAGALHFKRTAWYETIDNFFPCPFSIVDA